MRFEPRLLRPDEGTAGLAPAANRALPRDLELPAELELLAEQLMLEADRLAGSYPPAMALPGAAEKNAQPDVAEHSQPAIASNAAPQRARFAGLAWLRIAAAGLLVSAGAWLAWDRSQSSTMTSVGTVLHDVEVRPAEGPAAPSQLPVGAIYFQDLSGSEREGLLDLLEDQAADQASFSI